MNARTRSGLYAALGAGLTLTALVSLRAWPAAAHYDPGGAMGYGLGLAGSALAALAGLTALLRRRASLRHSGSDARWRTWHVAAGVSGIGVLVLHTGLACASGLGLIALASGLTVLAAGLVCRFRHPAPRAGRGGVTVHWRHVHAAAAATFVLATLAHVVAVHMY